MADETSRQLIDEDDTDTPVLLSQDMDWLKHAYVYVQREGRHLCRLQGITNVEDVEDILQEVSERLVRYSYSHPDSEIRYLQKWLRVIIRHCAIDFHRQRMHSAVIESYLLSEESDEEARRPDPADRDAQVNPEQAAIQKETVERTLFLLKELPEKYKQVLYLYLFQGFQASEIAKRCDLPLETVRTQLKRGLAKLRDAAVGMV